MGTGEKIKSLRREKGLNQSELAEMANISRIAVGNYERGNRQPNIDIMKRIAAVLEVSANDLLYDKKERKSELEELKYKYEAREEFIKLAKPLIKFLNNKFDPHTRIIIDSTTAEIVSGEICICTEEFVKD